MIPLRDENPSKGIPYVNILLIFANIAAFVHQKFLVFGGSQDLVLRMGYIPYELTHLVDIGPPSRIPIPLTIFTAMFMHGGWIHLLGNMLFLWIFGDNVEEKLGHFRYMYFFLMCGVAASLFHIFTNYHSRVPCIGASGAVAGIMGAYMFLFPRARIKTLLILGIFIQVVSIPAIVMLGYWILIQILSGFTEWGSRTGGGIAWFAHIGGFFAGFFLMIIMKKRKRRS